MSKLTSKAAASQGYTVDHHVYPWAAYKGPRFRPNEMRECLTDLEAELLKACKSRVESCCGTDVADLQVDGLRPCAECSMLCVAIRKAEGG